MPQLHDVAVRLDHFVGVAGPQGHEAGDGAQRGQVLDGLVRRTILAIAHGVVREHEDARQFHQGRQPDGRPRVVAEDEERRAKSPHLRQRQAVDDGRHPVLADAEMQVLAAPVPGLEAARALVRQGGLVRRPEVRRAPEEPRDALRDHVEHFAGGVSARDALGIRREDGEVTIPPCRQVWGGARRAARQPTGGTKRLTVACSTTSRSRFARFAGSRASQFLNVPCLPASAAQERGNISYHAPKRASRGSTNTRSSFAYVVE